MHILIKGKDGKNHIRKKSDIRCVYSTITDQTTVCFNGNKNTPIVVSETVEDFFSIHLTK